MGGAGRRRGAGLKSGERGGARRGPESGRGAPRGVGLEAGPELRECQSRRDQGVGGVRLEGEQWADRGSQSARGPEVSRKPLALQPHLLVSARPRRACGSAGLIHRALEEILCLHSLL